VREWIPISTSPKGRLVLEAVRQFGSRPYAEVTVGELSDAANVTTGAIYHHFGSKIGLYSFVRDDVEQRLIDRMEGALAAKSPGDSADGVAAALLVGFDFAVRDGFVVLLASASPEPGRDRLADLLGSWMTPASPVLGRILAAAWRAALEAVGDGADPAEARDALLALSVRS